MSYHQRHTGLSGLTDVASAAAAVVGDPCLSEVSTLVLRIQANQIKPTGPTSAGAPRAAPLPTKGIGLCKAVKPLQAAVWLSERPWVIPVGILTVVSGLFLAGYASGRSR